MFTASLIRLETVGKTAESGNRHVSFSYARWKRQRLVQSRPSRLAENRSRNPLDHSGRYNGQTFLPNVNGIGSDFLSLVRERIEVRVINSAKAATSMIDSSPSPLLDRGGEVTQSAIRHCRLLIGIPHVVMHPSLPLETAIPKAFGIALQILLRPGRRCDRALCRCSRSSSPR